MSTQHTPGPWSLNTQYADIEVRGPAESGVLITVMSPWGIAADTPNPQLQNARLIAAAPELLKALRDLEIGANTVAGCYARNPGNFAAALRDLSEYAEAARAAIAKATGSAS